MTGVPPLATVVANNDIDRYSAKPLFLMEKNLTIGKTKLKVSFFVMMWIYRIW